MQLGVEWENANQLDIQTILEMSEDGYTFGISNGKIHCVELTVRSIFR